MSEKVINELNERLKELETAEGYFITITQKVGETKDGNSELSHWQGSIDFPENDRLHSLNEIAKMVGINRKERRAIHLVKPRKFE